MKTDELLVRPGHPARLAERDPRATLQFQKKPEARKKLARDIERLSGLQDVFYAARSHALLIVLQGMDSAGKDSAVKHVMSGVNPEGVDVYSFKTPSDEEAGHDFLWRCARVVPARGRIGIFNRSYYEEVVVVRVHEEMLARESVIPTAGLWAERFADINAFEQHLARNGTLVLKFFLHLSKDEQRKRLLRRLDDEKRNWKFSENDVRERGYWKAYQAAYEALLDATSTDWAPWYVIPADRKWFVRTAIADIVVAQLAALGLQYPRLTGESTALLDRVRRELESD